MSTASNGGATGPPPRYTVVQQRLAHLHDLTEHAHRSLRLWRRVFYGVGLAAVAAAAAAGASSLADIWGSRTAGFLALAAAVLTAVDKFVGAGDKIARLDRRWQSLDALAGEVETILIDARVRESLLDGHDGGAVAGYDAWLAERCASVDGALKAINDRLDRV